MPYCAKCGSYSSLLDKKCPSCGHVFGTAGEDSSENLKSIDMKGVVYLLKAGKHYKIGKAKSFVKRYKEIKLQLPFDVEEIHQIKTNNIDKLEKHWHKRFHKYRKNGEWFDLNEKELEEFTSMEEVTYSL